MKALVLLTSFLMGCSGLPHDNPLDIDNPDGEANQVVVAENFIIKNSNAATTAPPYNQNSQDALYELTGTYGSKLLILEYHMIPTDISYQDSLGSSDNEFRYSNEYKGSANRGFPHTFFNGKQTGVQGASSIDNARTRYQTILDSATVSKVRIFCDVRKEIAGQTLTIETRIARYGNLDLNDIKVEFIVYEDKGDQSGKFTVRQILGSEAASIPAGTVLDMDPKPFTIPGFYVKANLGVVVIIKDNLTKKILQANIAN